MPTTLTPFAGPEAPVLLGVEHEYNATPWDDYGGYIDGCDCSDCHSNGGRSSGTVDDLLPEGWELKSEHIGSEITSAPCSSIVELVRTFRAIENRIGDEGHDNCGLHVHLNCTPAIGPAVNPFRFFRTFQRHKVEFLYPHVPGVGLNGRHQSGWTRQVPSETIQHWLNSTARESELNPHALIAHGTLEVRLGGATNQIDEMDDWLRRLATLAELSQYRPEEDMTTASVRYLYSGTVRHWLTHQGGVDAAEIHALQTEMIRRRAERVGS